VLALAAAARPAPSAPNDAATAPAAPAPDGARPDPEAGLPELTMDRAVAIALTRNRDVIAAKLEIREAELDRVEAGLYPNPVLSYSVGNLVLGAGNQGNVANGAPASPGFFSQPVHTIGVSEVIDVWAKRSARMRAADEGIRYRRLVVEDALREIVYSVRSAFAEVVREQSERELSRETRDRYAETVRLSRARFSAGEISDAELRKIELEGLKYENDVIDAEQQYDVAKQDLAALLGIGPQLAFRVVLPHLQPRSGAVQGWTTDALEHRPDLLAARLAGRYADLSLTAAKREALPDLSVGVAYTHSTFLVSGDNPNTLGLNVALPLPLFDRNQAGVGRAELAGQRAANDVVRLALDVRHDVADAARRVDRSASLIAVYEGGGMLDRASAALRVAENSYKAGAISLLELLEARRTYIETRAGYLRAEHDYRQSLIDLSHSMGEAP
jgi:cobalt-zinc-cadmium efflux system outer membrane protein